MSYPKFALAVMIFLHLITRSHMDYFLNLPQNAFMQMMSLLSDGLDSLNLEKANQAAFAFDFLATYYIKNYKKETIPAQRLRSYISSTPRFFQTMFLSLFQILVWGEALNQFTLARPLLPFLLAAELTQPDVIEAFRNDLVRSQPQEFQSKMNEEFLKLMRDITRSLDPVNRDKFAQRLTNFRVAAREFATNN
jgi:exportin-7